MEDWKELKKYREWIQVTDKNRSLVEDSALVGMMKIKISTNKKNELIEIAKLSSTGDYFNRTDQILNEKGIWPSIRRAFYYAGCLFT